MELSFVMLVVLLGPVKKVRRKKKKEAVRKRDRRRKEERKMGRGTEDRGMAVAVMERLFDFEEAVRRREFLIKRREYTEKEERKRKDGVFLKDHQEGGNEH